MKNKTTWSESSSQDSLKDIQDLHKAIMNSFTNPEIHVIPSCIAKQLENLQKLWEEGQKK